VEENVATYAIGDVHGCFNSLEALIERIHFEPGRDRLWFVGDLVNGGPDSAGVLRWAVEHSEDIVVVLGNHDLHMLAVADGAGKLRESDTFQDVFAAPDSHVLLDWLRRRPMIHRQGQDVVVHAGLLPAWTIEEAEEVARAIEAALQSPEPERRAFFEAMYGNEPRVWSSDLAGSDRLRIGVNAMTRMRIVEADDGALEFKFKGEYGDIAQGFLAWFDVPEPAWAGHRVICGHWSALGLVLRTDLAALDTGCVWGRQLTALRLDDGALFQVPGKQ
jgi:bis(5'-nucleosyl)-tetraphosphatase (symmetrical)